MIEVKSRSEESWGPLAKCDDTVFQRLIDGRQAKDAIKEHLKQQKKLKTYKVTFIKQLVSEQFEIQAESDYAVSSAAREFFKNHQHSIDFKLKPKSSWGKRAGTESDYDSISYVKVVKVR